MRVTNRTDVNEMADDEEDIEPPTDAEQCAKDGHCYCWRDNNASICCWCGAYNATRAKDNALNHLKKLINRMQIDYPDETNKIIQAFDTQPPTKRSD